MKRLLLAAVLVLTQLGCTPPPPASSPSFTKADIPQGADWTPAARAAFYTQDQGSRIMPLAWMKALRLADGTGFLADGLSRYGYLRNDTAADPVLPVGFTTNTDAAGVVAVGMTCAACHTRQIEVDGAPYRIDGGPAIVDFQSFLTDLNRTVGRTLADAAAFRAFADTVTGGPATDAQLRDLHRALSDWHQPYRTLMDAALPAQPWGPSRLDAVGMIFNRLTGLDIGPASDKYMIPRNIRRADAPVRYPFIWNAPLQDRTQWPGFASNGNDILGLGRNTGEVLGVFAFFHPSKNLLGVPDFRTSNSANTKGLMTLETLLRRIGKPRFPWPVQDDLVKRGQAIFNWPISRGSGCADCHGIKPEKDLLSGTTWCTPIQDVGTDNRQYNIVKWTANTGVLKGVGIPGLLPSLKATDDSLNVLKVAVVGSIIDHLDQVADYEIGQALKTDPAVLLQEHRQRTMTILDRMFAPKASPLCPSDPDKNFPYQYESRVMEGIWAAAPYLHNGAVPTLWDLLQPVSQRPKAFKIGPAYDPNGKVGLAAEQTKFDFTLRTTDCSDRNSGTSVCGHEYGVWLQPDEKAALLEYLKTL